MEEKQKVLIHSLCVGITQPNSNLSNIFDIRRAVCLAHYSFKNNLSLDNNDFINGLKENEHFNLDDDSLTKLAQEIVDKINYIKEIYRVTAEVEKLHI